jgi:hypothetical protein
MNGPGQVRAGCGHVDHRVTGFGSRQYARIPQNHLPDIIRKTHHAENNIAVLGHGFGRVGPGRPFFKKRAGFVARPVKTVSRCPAVNRCPHMDAPITPVPIHPMRWLGHVILLIGLMD